MYEHRCRAVCTRCGVFFDCEDLFQYDEVVTSQGERIIIPESPHASRRLGEGSA
jgi:hypothetical protein